MQKYYQLEWQAYHTMAHDLPRNLNDWLSDPGSFMQRLRFYGANNPHVTVLKQNWRFPLLDEKVALDISGRAYALIREVLIQSPGKKWMFARTVFPRMTLTGKQQCLARLKTRSLGSVLFKDPSLERSEFEVMCIHPGHPWHTYISKEIKTTLPELWARRSLFRVKNKPLLLTEVFLPDISQL